ncbi:MAG: radical SAM family heme chaperone HemW [Candidatus Marinimicrobia bacterium]|nr:radical SAM family heme chaperone HemW [Candidatus Neomarinimicrobiota bacterium]
MIKAGLYIHIPFCATKCMYCDFYSIADRNESIPRFIKALVKEIEQSSIDSSNWIFDTIFIGGGTPSLLEPNHIESILNALETQFDLSQIKEFTIEANPGEAPYNRLNNFHELGINRLSMGVQTFQPELLQFLTRKHSTQDVFDTFEHARKAGFQNINCDLIYSIPGQTWDMWDKDMSTLIQLNPDHISAYTLTVEKGTDLFHSVNNKSIIMPNNDITGDWFLKTHDYLASNGYSGYEISNFSKPGLECNHNLHYWNIEPYLGFGPSAHSFDGKNRWSNMRHLDGYLGKIELSDSPVSFQEELTPNQIQNEKIGFGLRMTQGIHHELVKKNLLRKSQDKWPDCIQVQNNRIRLTHEGMVFADAIGVDLMG